MSSGTSLVSIIIPVYNGSRYLDRVLTSVCAQTYKHLEIILINDGSTDNSIDVINSYIEGYSGEVKFVVVNQPNLGICAARNSGIDASTGDYIAFVDQDDFASGDYIGQLVSEIECKNSDIVIGGCYYFYEGNNKEEGHDLTGDFEWNLFRHTSPWARLYKASIIRENNVRFMDTKLSEDLYFNGVYISFCKTYSFIRQTGYRWVIREESESHKGMSNYAPDRDVIKVLSSMMDNLYSNCSVSKDLYEYLAIKHIAWYLLFIAPNTDYEILQSVESKAYEWLAGRFPNYYKNSNLGLLKPKGELFRIRAIVCTVTWLERHKKLMWFLKLYGKIA